MPDAVLPLSAEERADMRQRHERHPHSLGAGSCWGCGYGWPCDSARYEATCAVLEQERAEMIVTHAEQLREMEGLFRGRLDVCVAALREIWEPCRLPIQTTSEPGGSSPSADWNGGRRYSGQIARRALRAVGALPAAEG